MKKNSLLVALALFIGLTITYKTQCVEAMDYAISPENAAAEIGLDLQSYESYDAYKTQAQQTIATAQTLQEQYEAQKSTYEQQAQTYKDLGMEDEATEYSELATEASEYADQFSSQASTLQTDLTNIDSYIKYRTIGETPSTTIETDAKNAVTSVNKTTASFETLTQEIGTLQTTVASTGGEIETQTSEETKTEDTSGTDTIQGTSGTTQTTGTTETTTDQTQQVVEKTTITEWFTETVVEKMWNSIKDFFRPSTETKIDAQAAADQAILDSYTAAQTAYDSAFGPYADLKEQYIEQQLADQEAEFSDAEFQSWANEWATDLEAKAISNFQKANSDLATAEASYVNLIEKATQAYPSEAQTQMNSWIANPPSDVTSSELSSVTTQISQKAPTLASDQQNAALNEQFKAAFDFENPYSTLGLANSANSSTITSTYYAKLNELGASLTTLTNANAELVAGTKTFAEFQDALNAELQTKNPTAYAENPNQLFEIVDAYNLLTQNYVGGLVPERSIISDSGQQTFIGKTFIDTALNDITANFEAKKSQNQTSFNNITTNVITATNTVNQSVRYITPPTTGQASGGVYFAVPPAQ